MAQSSTAVAKAAPRSPSTVRPEPPRPMVRTWAPRIANLLPAVALEGGTGLPLSEVSTTITREGNGWVMTLVWLAGIIALLSVFVFPYEERFIQTVAISLASLTVLVLPFYV